MDGSQHGEDADASRTASLERRGYQVIQFWNNDVLARTETVLEAILAVLRAGPHPGR